MSGEKEFITTHQKLTAARQHRITDLIEQAQQKALSLSLMLKTHHLASKVTLFGSLARGTFQAHSDIDLMVQGFKGSYWEMLIRAEEIAHPFPLNIICYEDAPPALLEEVKTHGVIL